MEIFQKQFKRVSVSGVGVYLRSELTRVDSVYLELFG